MAIADGLLKFGEYCPDISDLDTGVSPNIQNVVPRGDGYGPFPDFAPFTQALPSACRGFFFARNADGSITVFCGTQTNIWKLDNTLFGWVNVGTYPALSSNANWQFVQFNSLVIAVQINVQPQVYNLATSSAFANLGGSPPQASFIAVINRFLLLGGLSGLPYRVQWSGLNAVTTWDNITAQSNYQDMADGGRVTGIAGGDQFGIIFQDSAVRSMIFSPGAPAAFDILRIATNDGLLSPFASVNSADSIYFCSPQGFKVIAPGGYPTPIGKEKVDRTFFADVDTSNLQLFIAATDPTTTRVYWAYKSTANPNLNFDKIIIYDRILNKWSRVLMSGQFLASLSKPGLTLEALDALAPGIISVEGAANNGSGAIRLTLSGLTAGTGPSNTNLNIENTCTVYGITTGTIEANGTWRFTIIDSTHINLIGSTFTHAYTSGGSIGGSLDQLGYSLDSISLASLAQLAMVGTANTLGFFNGPNLEGTMETPEQDGDGQRIYISAMRPMTDCPDAAVSLAIRDTAQAMSVYTTEETVNYIGIAPVTGGGVDTRYARAKVRNPYGSTWTYAMGVAPEFTISGSI